VDARVPNDPVAIAPGTDLSADEDCWVTAKCGTCILHVIHGRDARATYIDTPIQIDY